MALDILGLSTIPPILLTDNHNTEGPDITTHMTFTKMDDVTNGRTSGIILVTSRRIRPIFKPSQFHV